jgi:hypothetical protein
MNYQTSPPWWKMLWHLLVAVVALDWLLDGRLRDRLPWNRRNRPPGSTA